jgi:hypothetical protein
MSEDDLLPELDEPPKSGVFVEHDHLGALTPEEIALGQELGRAIDVDNDDDRDGGLL